MMLYNKLRLIYTRFSGFSLGYHILSRFTQVLDGQRSSQLFRREEVIQ